MVLRHFFHVSYYAYILYRVIPKQETDAQLCKEKKSLIKESGFRNAIFSLHLPLDLILSRFNPIFLKSTSVSSQLFISQVPFLHKIYQFFYNYEDWVIVFRNLPLSLISKLHTTVIM
jgi:hypothetical protein